MGADRQKLPHQRWWIWVVFVSLFALSVPWYVPRHGLPRIWLGLPFWVGLSLLAVVAVALFAVFVIQRFWQDDDFR